MIPSDYYNAIAQGIYQFGLMGILAAGILTWLRYRLRARVYGAAARPVYQTLWLCLLMAGGGAVWAHINGAEVTTSFVNAALQVVLAMALLPAGIVLLRRSGFARAPHLRLFDLERHSPLDLPTRASRRRAILADSGWQRTPWVGVALWTLAVVGFSIVYYNVVMYLTTQTGWGEWLGGEPKLSPEIEKIFENESTEPLLVMGQLLSAAVSEEVLFRMVGLGVVALLLRRQGGGRDQAGLAIVIVSLVFAFGHAGWLVQPFWKEFHMFGVGLMLGWMVRRYGATASIPAHMALNLLASFEVLFAI